MLTLEAGKRLFRRRVFPHQVRPGWGWKRYVLTSGFALAMIWGAFGLYLDKDPNLLLLLAGALPAFAVGAELLRDRVTIGAGCSVRRQSFDMRMAIIKNEMVLESVTLDRPKLEVPRFHPNHIEAMPCPLCGSYGWRRGKSGHFICRGDD